MPAADTLKLTLQQAEKTFLDSNLQLLAAHYNILSNKALVEQARKWDNPVLNTDQNVYANNRFFEHGKDAAGNPTGEIFVQVQQLIRTAGKRGHQVDLAKTNVNIAEWQFNTVMRELRSTLIRDFYSVARLQGNAVLFNDNMDRLSKLEMAMKSALASGNIAKKEYLRVQALIMSLKQDITENARDLVDVQSELKTLLQVTGNIFILPVADDNEPARMPDISIFAMLDSAARHNTDYNREVYQSQYAKQSLKLQKSLAVPDITIGTEYDNNSNYTPNYYGLALSLPIPLWDRNKGNIKAANWQVKAEEATLRQYDHKLKNDVLGAYQKLQSTVNLTAGTNAAFYTDYGTLYKNIVESYNNRQISLIEFLEYFKDYQEIKKDQLQQVFNLRLAKQELNDVVGLDVAK